MQKIEADILRILQVYTSRNTAVDSKYNSLFQTC